jgi:hypothetical protein
VRPAKDYPQIAALVLDPKTGPESLQPPQPGDGEIVWASPQLAKALGGSTLGSIAGTAKIYPLKPSKASALDKARHGVELFDSAGLPLSDVLKGIAEDAVKSNQLSATGGSLFKSTIAGAEIVLELTNPSDKSVLEKMLSITLHGVELTEPVTDWVPHLAHAKPYLVAVVNVGGQLMAAIQTRANEAQALNPAGANYLSKPGSAR